ncbi:hypothetical protein [Ewingella americana]
MDTKAAFEKFREWWFAEEQTELRLNFAEGWGFRVWLASRAAIEIELPDKLIEEDYYDGGYNCAIKYCSQAITSHGIRIKGKTE